MKKTNPDSSVSCETFIETLNRELSFPGIELQNETATKLYLFWEHLCSWNSTHNLTSVTTYEDAVQKHFVDSLLPVLIPSLFNKVEKVLDFGTGAGFPGVPLSLYFPHINFTLLDKARKKTSFLQFLSASLDIPNIYPINAEISQYFEKFDIIISRAVNLNEKTLHDLAKNLLPGGTVVSYLSEFQSPVSGIFEYSGFEFDLPFTKRKIFCYRF